MTLSLNYRMLVLFILTILSAGYWCYMPPFWSIGILFFIACCLWQKMNDIIGVLVALIIVIAHGNLMQTQASTLWQAEQNIIIKAKVISFFQVTEYGYEGQIELLSINDQVLVWWKRPKIQLNAPVALQRGEILTADVRLKAVYGQLNEAGFDRETYYLSQGLSGIASIKKDEDFHIEPYFSLRNLLYQHVEKQSRELKSQGLMLALMFGERSKMSPQLWQDLRNSGLIHLVAISGLHISLVFGIGYLLALPFSRGHPVLLWLPFGIGLVLATSYAWLAGFPIPTQRALIMCVLNVALIISGIHLTAWQRIILTMALLLLLSPFAALSVSFWLSLCAVSLVIYQMAQASRKTAWWRSLLFAQLSLSLLMAPISALFFSGFSWSSAVYNVIFIPWFSFVIVPSLFLVVLMSVLSITELPLLWQLLEMSFSPLHWALAWVGESWFVVSRLQSKILLIGLLLWLCRHWCHPRYFLLLLFSLFSYFYWQPKPNWSLDVLDVGHGLAVLIERNNKVIVYDTGASWNGGSIAQLVILPVLQSRGITQLDGIIISHSDNDHAGGLADLSRALAPQWIMASEYHSQWRACIQGESWQWQGLNFQVLWPPQLAWRAENPHSCVIKMEDPEYGHSVLLTGDVTEQGEWLMLSQQAKHLTSDVMLVAHHGSKTSSAQAFIQQVSPELAIASVPKASRWNLPHPSIVSRYQEQGIAWQDTGQDGQIRLEYYQHERRLRLARTAGNSAWYRQTLRNEVE